MESARSKSRRLPLITMLAIGKLPQRRDNLHRRWIAKCLSKVTFHLILRREVDSFKQLRRDGDAPSSADLSKRIVWFMIAAVHVVSPIAAVVLLVDAVARHVGCGNVPSTARCVKQRSEKRRNSATLHFPNSLLELQMSGQGCLGRSALHCAKRLNVLGSGVAQRSALACSGLHALAFASSRILSYGLLAFYCACRSICSTHVQRNKHRSTPPKA